MPFSAIYPNFTASDTFVNLDVGLVEIDDISRWTTDVLDVGVVGDMADYSGVNLRRPKSSSDTAYRPLGTSCAGPLTFTRRSPKSKM